MGFVCPECNNDFGTNKEAFLEHMMTHKGSVWNDFVQKPPRAKSKTIYKKKSVDMNALGEAIEDGRISFHMSFDGEGFLENKRTHKRVSIGFPLDYGK